MVEEFIPLTNDLLFKEALAHKDNREALIYFLKSTTKFSEEVIRKNLVVKYESIQDKTRVKDKSFRSDVDIRFDNYYINLEGYSHFDNNSLAKSTSYIMRIFSTQLDRGKKYINLDSMIQINIIENDETGLFKEFKNEYYIINSKDLDNRILPNKFMIKYYNIDKINDGKYNEDSDEVRWIKFIGAKSRKERSKIAKGDKVLISMENWVEEYVNDERTKRLFGEWGENIALEKGFRKGLKQGFNNGIKEKSFEIAKALTKKGFDIEEIMDITKLSKEEIENII